MLNHFNFQLVVSCKVQKQLSNASHVFIFETR